MEIPPISEDELTLIVGYTALNEWKECGGDFKYLTILKMHKIIFETSEQLQLPITRCWYIRGSYIPNPYIMKRDFLINSFNNPEKVILRDGSEINLLTIIKTFDTFIGQLSLKISQILENTNIIFTKERDYLKNLYRDKVPKEYSESYKRAYEFSTFLMDLRKSRTNLNETLFGYYGNCKNLVTELHKSLKKVEDFDPVFDIIIKYSDIIEEAIIKIDIEQKNNKNIENYPNKIEFLNNQSDFYLENIWKYFAKIVAINTAKGKRAENIKIKYSKDIKDLSQVYKKIEQIGDIAERLNLTLSGDEYLRLLEDRKGIIEKINLIGNILERG